MDDTLAIEEDEELEEEADAEVDKVLFELTNGKLGQAGTIKNEAPVCYPAIVLLYLPKLPLHRLWKTNWKTKRQKESWNSTGSSSVASSADRLPAYPHRCNILESSV